MRGPGRPLAKLTPAWIKKTKKSATPVQRHAPYATLNDVDMDEMQAMMDRATDPRFTVSEQATARRLAAAAAKRLRKKRSGS